MLNSLGSRFALGGVFRAVGRDVSRDLGGWAIGGGWFRVSASMAMCSGMSARSSLWLLASREF